MLTNLRIQNFKSWKDTGNIRMAPITLFFGRNSSGKSSIAQFLMMLKLTIESNDRQTVFQTGGREQDPIDLGAFHELLHNRENGTLKFDLGWQSSAAILHEGSDHSSQISFSAETSAKESKGKFLPHVDAFHYTLTNKEGTKTLGLGMKQKGGKWDAIAEGVELKKNTGRQWPLGAPVKFYEFSSDFSKRYQGAEQIQDLHFAMEKLANRLTYLGPLRTKPRRDYTWNNDTPTQVDYVGSSFLAALLAAEDKELNLGERKSFKKLHKLIAEELKCMRLIHDFRIRQIGGSHRYTVELQVNKGSPWVDLPDVGCGISQVLPVLTQCFVAPKDSILLFEQPELHLHPSAQSDLADVMIHAIRSRERSGPRNLQLVIETHSEHFLRRLQRRIADETIKPEDVACYVVEPNAKGHSDLVPLKVDLFGYITNWPKDFFGDLMDEAVRQQLAMLERKGNKPQTSKEAADV